MIDKFYKDFEIRDYLDEELNIKNEVIDCSLGINPFIDCQYTDPNYSKLKDCLIDMYKSDLDIKFNYNNISFGTGSMGIIRNLVTFLVNDKTNVLMMAPSFSRTISEIELFRGNIKYYYLEKDNYKFNCNNFIKCIDNINIVWIDNPNNPTGSIISIKDIESIVKYCNDRDIMVVIDEAYGDYMSINNSSVNLVNKYNNIIVIKSASKVFGLPNDRVGYVISCSDIIDIYNKILVPFPISEESINKFIDAIKNRKYILDRIKEVKNIKKFILDSIDSNNYLNTSLDTPIFCIYSDKYNDLYKELLNNGILAENCSCFEGLNNKYARIRVSSDKEKVRDILVKVLD